MEHVTAEGGTFAVWRFLTEFTHAPPGAALRCEIAQHGDKLVILARTGDGMRVVMGIGQTKHLANMILATPLPPLLDEFAADMARLARALLDIAAEAEALAPERRH